jgi:hypothetical protein
LRQAPSLRTLLQRLETAMGHLGSEFYMGLRPTHRHEN